jgi:hypothetical protein
VKWWKWLGKYLVSLVIIALLVLLVIYVLRLALAIPSAMRSARWERLPPLPDGQQPAHFLNTGTPIVYIEANEDKVFVLSSGPDGSSIWEEVQRPTSATEYPSARCSIDDGDSLNRSSNKPPGTVIEQLMCEYSHAEISCHFTYALTDTGEIWSYGGCSNAWVGAAGVLLIVVGIRLCGIVALVVGLLFGVGLLVGIICRDRKRSQ